MNLVRSKYWPHVFVGGMIFSVIISLIFLFLNLTKVIPEHSGILDFLPLILWIIVAILLAKIYGSQEQKELQKISGYTISGIIAFFGALILGVFSLKENSKTLFIITIIFFYSISFWSWLLLKKDFIKRKIKISWKTLWIMTGLLFVLIIFGQLLTFFTLNIIGHIILFGGITLIYQFWGKNFFQELKQKQVAFQMLIFLAFNLISFILWTAIFLFLSYGFFFK